MWWLPGTLTFLASGVMQHGLAVATALLSILVIAAVTKVTTAPTVKRSRLVIRARIAVAVVPCFMVPVCAPRAFPVWTVA